ncbi:PfkB family carbohydrate kinase [Streptomyces albulus]|nr:PfkB family carbohydrate kinase [Streptomyces noursei]
MDTRERRPDREEERRMYDVLVVGSANADLTVRVTRRPGAGETVLGTDLVESAGGKVPTRRPRRPGSAGAPRCWPGSAATPTGSCCSPPSAAGTDVAPVIVDADARTGTAMIIVSPDGDNSIVVSPGANAALTPQDVAAAQDVIAASAVLSSSWRSRWRPCGRPPRPPRGRHPRRPQPLADPEDLDRALLSAADPLVVNEHEARQLSGRTDGTPPSGRPPCVSGAPARSW